MNWEPRALHKKPSANEHSKVIFAPIILSCKYFLQGPNCTCIQALIVLSRTYSASDKNKNTIKLICSVCCISHAGEAALNASVLGLSQVTNWILPALDTQASPQGSSHWHCCTGATASQPGLRLLHSGCTSVMILLDIPKNLHPPLCRLAPCLYRCLVWKNTLHRSGLQSDSSGSTFKVTVKPGVVLRATERSTQHTPTPLPSSSYQFSASLGSISTNEGRATLKNWIKQHSFLPYLLQKNNTFSWISQNH